jgi:hypothetical protein
MRRRRTVLALLWIAGPGLLATAGGSWAQDEDLGGLAPGPGQEVVYYTCNVCHSIRLVTQQRLSRERWDKLLEGMVEEQGMAEPAPEDRELILDYLAAHYGADAAR